MADEKKPPPFDTFNKFGVGRRGRLILITSPHNCRILTPDDARNLAAHLAVTAYDAVGPTVPELIDAIENQ